MSEDSASKIQRRVPLIVASALIMQQIDSTALATSIPSMAESLGVSAVELHWTVTAYFLSLGIFLSLSGWTADRFGARRTFVMAIAVFTGASLLCGAASGLPQLIAARCLQGLGGAMMLPTGRLILLRSVPKSEIVPAMVMMGLPTIIGPAIGPLFGGLITMAASWRWIFWINLPVGLVAIALTLLFIRPIPASEPRPFDLLGFCLSSVGIGALVLAIDLGTDRQPHEAIIAAAIGAVSFAAYVWHALRAPDPILDLRLFRHATFRASLFGGSLFRAGVAALPFMLPLFFQGVLGYSPIQSGAMTFASAVGAFGMRTSARRVLARFGYRRILIVNALIAGLSMGLCGMFGPDRTLPFMVLIVLIGGVFRSLQLTSVNTLAFADVDDGEMSHATTISQVMQRLMQGVGVAFAAFLLNLFSNGAVRPDNLAFAEAFAVVGVISALSSISFFMLPRGAGNTLVGRD